MAGLAAEFNSMSDQLSAQMGELRRQRTELEQSVTRIGEAFASGLDRTALLEIVAETAKSACEAEHARILLAGSQEPEAAVGEPLSDPVEVSVLGLTLLDVVALGGAAVMVLALRRPRVREPARAGGARALHRAVALGPLVLFLGLLEHPDQQVRQRDAHHDRLFERRQDAGDVPVVDRGSGPSGCRRSRRSRRARWGENASRMPSSPTASFVLPM